MKIFVYPYQNIGQKYIHNVLLYFFYISDRNCLIMEIPNDIVDTSDLQNCPDFIKPKLEIDQSISRMKSEFHDNSYTLNCDEVDTNDIDVKPDLQTLQSNIQISKCEIKQEITQVDIKTEVEDDIFENFSEVPLKVEIKTEKNDFTQFENDNQLVNNEFNQQYFVQQKSEHEIVEDHKCLACGKGFSKSNILNAHIKLAHKKGEKDFKCSLCEKGFTQYGELKKHVERVHEKILKAHNCQQCQKNFTNAKSLRKHIKAVHEGIKDRYCNHCGKGFSRTANLKIHIKSVHEGVKDYKCDHCDKSFSANANLINHVKVVHEGVKDYKCDHCEKSFSKHGHLKDHIKRIHEEKDRR